MKAALYLAIRYLKYHRLSTLLLIAALTLTMLLPILTRQVIQRFRAQALQRAEHTPLVIGAKGGSFGLALHALYFRGDPPPAIAYRELQSIEAMKLGQVVPLLARYKAHGRLIVGTSNDYLRLRGLVLARGEPMERWGDCLLGWNAAREFQLKTGDSLLTEPENMLNVSGPAPLKLRVRGVVARTGEADDDVVFSQLETAWIMAGIGHGHHVVTGKEAVESSAGEESHAHAGENQLQYSEVTSENVNSFHFHGQKADYPLTACLVFPDSDRSAALIEGKFLSPDQPCQAIEPTRIVDEFMHLVARIQQLLDAVSVVLGLATLLLIVLVVLLSLRLRAAEFRTLKLLGASRYKLAQILTAELMIVVFSSCFIAIGLSIALSRLILIL